MKRAVAASLPGQPRTIAEAVYDRLRADLLNGRYEPGAALRLEPLMARYGCGVSPLREALQRLAADRLVRSIGQRGFQAAGVSPDEMWELVRLRQLLEIEALTASIGAGDAAWEAGIVAAFHTLTRAKRGPAGADAQNWEACHAAFHRALVAACPSQWLLHMVGMAYSHTERYRRLRLERTDAARLKRDVAAEHRALMEAVLARDKKRAARLLRAHLEATAAFVAGELAKREKRLAEISN